MSLGDQEFFNIAEQIEKDLDVDMNLRDIFSNDLNSYFNFQTKDLQWPFNLDSNIVEFNFELDEGSARIVLENPRDYYDLKINNVFDEDLYYCMHINTTLSDHINNSKSILKPEITDCLYILSNAGFLNE